MINENLNQKPLVNIEIRPIDGSAPVEFPGIAQFVVITVPSIDPEHNTNAHLAVSPRLCAEIGMWLIQCSKAMVDGKDIPPLGQFEKKNPRSSIIQPGLLPKKNGIVRPGLN